MMDFKEFLDLNPSEVVVFFFKITSYVDEPLTLSDFFFQLFQIRGFANMVYRHGAPNSTWPTLRELTNPVYNKVSLARHFRASCDF